jgi:hypothetical protein
MWRPATTQNGAIPKSQMSRSNYKIVNMKRNIILTTTLIVVSSLTFAQSKTTKIQKIEKSNAGTEATSGTYESVKIGTQV